MTLYIDISTLAYPLSRRDIASLFPTISFPTDDAARDAAFAERGFLRVVEVPQPAYDPETHRIKEGLPTIPAQGPSMQTWVVIPLTQAELDAALAEWREQTSVTPRQLRLALLDLNMLDQVEAIVASSPRDVQVEWEYSVLYERRAPHWDALGAAAGITPTAIDNAFRLALTKV